jgi:hypothetical protein
MNIYLACALTHVPTEFFEQYTTLIYGLATQFSNKGHAVKCALADSDPQLAEHPEENKAKLCYEWDREMVLWADLVVAECSFPSTGMGIELQIADNDNIPIVLCYSDYGWNRSKPKSYSSPNQQSHQLQVGKGYISLMALGLPCVISSIRYLGLLDCIESVVDTINKKVI